jgi:hypothetical protein
VCSGGDIPAPAPGKELTMAEPQSADGKPFDPMDAWRTMRDTYLDSWAKAMMETVNTEAYAKATGNMLDTYLTMSNPFRESLEKAMLQTLQQLSMPSRADFISLAERMNNLELRIDDMDAKIDHIVKILTKPATPRKTDRVRRNEKKGANNG